MTNLSDIDQALSQALNSMEQQTDNPFKPGLKSKTHMLKALSELNYSHKQLLKLQEALQETIAQIELEQTKEARVQQAKARLINEAKEMGISYSEVLKLYEMCQ